MWTGGPPEEQRVGEVVHSVASVAELFICRVQHDTECISRHPRMSRKSFYSPFLYPPQLRRFPSHTRIRPLTHSQRHHPAGAHCVIVAAASLAGRSPPIVPAKLLFYWDQDVNTLNFFFLGRWW